MVHGLTPEHRYPDFLCIGAQKAGTTWLDKNLRRHPKLWLPPMKELQYFSELYIPAARRWTTRQRRERGSHLLKRYATKVAPVDWDYRYIARVADLVAGPIGDFWYGRMFALAEPEQVCGEVTPDYCTLPDEGIRHVLRLSPEVKIILSLRDPIERCWSHIRMTARTRGIADAEGLERMARNADLVQRADYPAMIAHWREFIPAERFLVIFMDDIAAEPGAVLDKVCAFLGVPPRHFAKADEAVHEGVALEMPPAVLAALKERLAPVYEGITALYPEIGARWASRHY
jgi:hypothetical protein